MLNEERIVFEESTVYEDFHNRLEASLGLVSQILGLQSRAVVLTDRPHTYDFKLQFVEFLSSILLASHLNCLQILGLDDKKLHTLLEAAQTRNITIRFKSQETCKFVKEVERKKEVPYEAQSQITGFFSSLLSWKTVLTSQEYYWNYVVQYQIYLFVGTDVDAKIELRSGTFHSEIITQTKESPLRTGSSSDEIEVINDSCDLNLSWLLSHFDIKSLKPNFWLDKNERRYRTPFRNVQIQLALKYSEEFTKWSRDILYYFSKYSSLFKHGHYYSKMNDIGFAIEVPTFIQTYEGDQIPSPRVPDPNFFLSEEKRCIYETFANFRIPEDQSSVTVDNLQLLTVLNHMNNVSRFYEASINHLELHLKMQLLSAIGKVLTPDDFRDYMKYHFRKHFREEFQPLPFSYHVRRPLHSPEGEIQILDKHREPLRMHGRKSSDFPLKIPISAATTVETRGDNYFHGVVFHQFDGSSDIKLSLNARSRPFSLFAVLVGCLATRDVFEAKCGIIVRNEDTIDIPLDLDVLPTPKQFRDAVESLSPEQQRFAKQYRAMQIAGTLFGVVVIQVKPQLETLLKLPEGSLTKEIQLTEDLLNLFLDYDISSDLLSFQGHPDSSVQEKLATVRANVDAILQMISDEKEQILEQKRREAEMLRLEQERIQREKEEKEAEARRLAERAASTGQLSYLAIFSNGELVLDASQNYFSKSTYAAIAKRVIPKTSNKSAFSHSNNQIFVLPDKEETYIAMTEQMVTSRQAFGILEAVKYQFQPFKYSPSTFANQLKNMLTFSGDDRILRVQAEVDYVKSIMVQNIDRVLERGDTLDSLVDQSLELSFESKSFVAKASRLQSRNIFSSSLGAISGAISSAASMIAQPTTSSLPANDRMDMSMDMMSPDQGLILPSISSDMSGGAPPVEILPPPEAQETVETPVEVQKQQEIQDSKTTEPEEKPKEVQKVQVPERSQIEEVDDFTKVPTNLSQQLETYDTQDAMHPIIIKPSAVWEKKSRPSLLSPLQTQNLEKTQQEEEKRKVFQLLETLSCSGNLPISNSSFHALVAISHCFSKSILNTAIEDNINPIEMAHFAEGIVGGVVHKTNPAALCDDNLIMK